MRFVKFVLIFLVSFVVLTSVGMFYVYIKLPKLENSVNILILGKGGEGHTAPNLTDTIMLSKINKESQKVSIFSLPRDIWIDPIKAKLNTAYYYGGFKMVGESIKEVTGQPVNYVVVVDFSLFKDLVDSIGGINVEVENSFIDERYPIAGLENDLCDGDRLYKCRYETIQFSKGLHHMNGELALKFVRSRNAVGDEGTDLAREKRQQAVISAVRKKVLSREVLLDKNVLQNLYNILITHIETNMDQKTMMAIARFAVESKFSTNFLSIPDGILKVSQNEKKYDRQYVFVPKNGSWKELQEWIQKEM